MCIDNINADLINISNTDPIIRCKAWSKQILKKNRIHIAAGRTTDFCIYLSLWIRIREYLIERKPTERTTEDLVQKLYHKAKKKGSGAAEKALASLSWVRKALGGEEGKEDLPTLKECFTVTSISQLHKVKPITLSASQEATTAFFVQ